MVQTNGVAHAWSATAPFVISRHCALVTAERILESVLPVRWFVCRSECGLYRGRGGSDATEENRARRREFQSRSLLRRSSRRKVTPNSPRRCSRVTVRTVVVSWLEGDPAQVTATEPCAPSGIERCCSEWNRKPPTAETITFASLCRATFRRKSPTFTGSGSKAITLPVGPTMCDSSRVKTPQ